MSLKKIRAHKAEQHTYKKARVVLGRLLEILCVYFWGLLMDVR